MDHAPYIKTDNSLLKYLTKYYIAILPLILFGIYKNGVYLYQQNFISFGAILKVLILPIISLFTSIIIEMSYQKLKKDKINLLESPYILYSIIIAMMMPYHINYLVYIVLLFFTLLILRMVDHKNLISPVLVIYLIFFLVFSLYDNTAFNTFKDENLTLSNIKIILGMYSGGIFITSNILCIVGYLLLKTNFIYKKDIPLYILITYLICSFIYCLITKTNLVTCFLNPILFTSVFIAPNLFYSPYTKNGRRIYSIIIGILCFLLIVVFKLSYGSILVIAICQAFHKTFDNLKRTDI